jgi:hypothetical protein
MTRDSQLFLVAAIVAVVAWTVTFRLIGGTLPKGRGAIFGEGITWGMRWRSAPAALVAASAAAYALEAAKLCCGDEPRESWAGGP